MRYNIYINQIKAMEWGLSHSEAMVFDIMSSLSSWASPEIIDWEVYYYLSTGKMLEQLPIIGDNKRSFNNIIKKLKDKELLVHITHKNKSYYRLSDKWIWWLHEKECHQKMTGRHQKVTEGVIKKWNNNIIIYNNIKYNIMSASDEIYRIYHSKLSKDKKKYVKSADAKLQISKALSEYSMAELINAISYYFRKTDMKYIMAPQYFFSYKKDWKYYKPFVDYINTNTTEKESLTDTELYLFW